MNPNPNKSLIPFAIVVAGLLIGGAIIYTHTTPAPVTPTVAGTTAQPETIPVVPPSAKDHIQGNLDAKVVVIEYSDTECPFCKQFHVSLHRLITNYSKDNMVAWVYRQFPIPQLHPKAPKEAEATECVAQLGDEEKFWQYLDKVYAVTPSNNGLDPAKLPALAKEVGVDVTAFNNCLSSGTNTEFITNAFNEARTLGAQGTPYTVIVPRDKVSATTLKQLTDLFTVAGTQMGISPDKLGTVAKDGKVVLNGALPYEIVQQIIAILLS